MNTSTTNASSFGRALRMLAPALMLGALTGNPAMSEDGMIERLLEAHPERFARLTEDPAEFRVQVLLSVVGEDEQGRPTLERDGYRLEEEYFYPASTIKIFGAAAALIRLEQLRNETGLPIRHDTPMVIHPLFDDEQLQDRDPSNVATGQMTIEHEIRKTLLVSSNSAYNHLFEFVGHEPMHEILREVGLPEVRLNHRLSEFRSREDNRRSPRIDFVLEDGTVYTIPRRESNLVTDNAGMNGLKIGKGYMWDGELVNEPLDFLYKNHASLRDLQDFMIKIVRPDIDLGTPPLPISDHDRQVLLRALREHPHESANPVYTIEDISVEHGCPHYQPGVERVVPRDEIVIYAKSGQAYGFEIENAAVVHEPTGRTFFLAATIYVNSDGVLNDDQYDYDLADAFLIDLSEVVARELWAK